MATTALNDQLATDIPHPQTIFGNPGQHLKLNVSLTTTYTISLDTDTYINLSMI